MSDTKNNKETEILDPNDVADKMESLIGYLNILCPFVEKHNVPFELPDVLEEAAGWCKSIRNEPR